MENPLIINFCDQKSGHFIRVLYSDMAYTDRAIALVNIIIKQDESRRCSCVEIVT